MIKEKILYKIGKLLSIDDGFDDEYDDDEYVHPIKEKDGNPILNMRTLHMQEFGTNINIIQKTGIRVCNFGVYDCKIGHIYSPKVLHELEQRKNHTMVFVKVRCKEIEGKRRINSRHIFYTIGHDNTTVKVSIESYCTFYANDEQFDEIAMEINGFSAKMVISTSNLRFITNHELVVPISYRSLDVINTCKVNGYLSVLGNRQTFINADIEESEPINEFGGHFDDEVPFEDDPNTGIDLSRCVNGSSDCIDKITKVISIEDGLRYLKRKVRK